ncbi:hypothetical protein IJV79_01690 [bacterium]|nr:hypothetical protein [bacterium]
MILKHIVERDKVVIQKISFASRREDKNYVEKLKLHTNALNFNNQRNISQAIDNLSKDSSTKNINFLMNVADQIRYGLNCGITDVKPNNNWMEQLKNATEKSLAKNNTASKEALQARFKQVFENNKELTEQEKTVLSLRENLLKTPGLKNEINTSDNDNVRDINKNLDYFVVSSETSIDEKVQVLEKLNKFMSPEYKIEKQLENKKAQVLGEVLNDIVVKTAEQDRPTIKQVDQRHHGMCAAISIARKAMAYEYKPQYVDIIMEELKDSKDMEVYDISKLGTGAKISVPKTEIDYAYAEEKGYRLIDASTLQWMNIAGTEGNGSVVSNHFSAFDREYFDTFHDSHYHRDFGNPVADTMNTYLRALEKANAQASSTIKKFQKNSKDAFEQNESKSHNVQRIANINRTLAKNLTALMPETNEDTLYSTVNELTRLNQDKNHPFYIVDAEEDITKKAKIAKFIESKNPTVDKKLLDSKMENIFNLYTDAVEINEYMSKDFIPKTPKDKMMKLYKPLYEVAAMHRTAIDKRLDIEENRMNMIEELRMNENSSKADVMKKLENKGEIVSEEILRGLQTKYNRIAKHAAVVEKAEVKGDVVKVEGLYDIEPKEVAALKNVLANLNNIHNSLKAETRFMQETMNDVLNAQAKQIGFETGSNWVGKEGSSGLSRPQQIRIFEQMTGQRFYAEKSLDRTAEFIKDSNHSGITASNVYHNDHGWHAMYVADLAQVPVKNAQTGKMETKDAIMYDNSWGYAEKKNTWVDSNGLERTDYACGRGGDTGYITNKLWQNGTLVDDYKNKPGVVGDYKFRMFTEAVLPTSKTLATNDTQEIFNSILTNRAQNTQRLALLENAIKRVISSLKTSNNSKSQTKFKVKLTD